MRRSSPRKGASSRYIGFDINRYCNLKSEQANVNQLALELIDDIELVNKAFDFPTWRVEEEQLAKATERTRVATVQRFLTRNARDRIDPAILQRLAESICESSRIELSERIVFRMVADFDQKLFRYYEYGKDPNYKQRLSNKGRGDFHKKSGGAS